MDDAKKRQLTEKLLKDIEAWDQSQRGFQDIVRNAVDIDKRHLRDLMKAFDVAFADVKAWGAGTEVPEDYKRYVIVEAIRKMLAADLGT
ncbi:MAG TPA: hypothetical protein VJ694_05160 [Patescibacteria group bacterium]|nr:hypothetical protein [Patescibacteria group bacterium]